MPSNSLLNGRVAIVTGGGRGLGRAHCLALARAGASVVVNDLGAGLDGSGTDDSAAASVVAEIRALGGSAVVSGHDVSNWEAARDLIDLASKEFGSLDILVNNAGIVRDRTLANMDERDWDDVVRVHLKGHAAPTRHAVAHWRELSKLGQPVQASVIHTSSASGLVGNFGQANYAAAKLAVVALSSVVNLECGRFGVRSNVIAPVASTRMAETAGGTAMHAGREPEKVSPLVVWLAQATCPAADQVFEVHGRRISTLKVPSIHQDLRSPDPEGWSVEELNEILPGALVDQLAVADLIDEWDFS